MQCEMTIFNLILFSYFSTLHYILKQITIFYFQVVEKIINFPEIVEENIPEASAKEENFRYQPPAEEKTYTYESPVTQVYILLKLSCMFSLYILFRLHEIHVLKVIYIGVIQVFPYTPYFFENWISKCLIFPSLWNMFYGNIWTILKFILCFQCFS